MWSIYLEFANLESVDWKIQVEKWMQKFETYSLALEAGAIRRKICYRNLEHEDWDKKPGAWSRSNQTENVRLETWTWRLRHETRDTTFDDRCRNLAIASDEWSAVNGKTLTGNGIQLSRFAQGLSHWIWVKAMIVRNAPNDKMPSQQKIPINQSMVQNKSWLNQMRCSSPNNRCGGWS